MAVRRVILQIGSLELAGNRASSEIAGAGGSTATQTLMGIWTGAAWADLTPGVNSNPNVGDDKWGPEIGYREALLPEYPTEKLYLIKYCVASTLFPISGTNSWSPHLTGQTYSAFITWLTAAAAAANGAGDSLSIDTIVIGISASEMVQTAGTRSYGEMLYALINTLRAVIPTIPYCTVGTLRNDGGKTPVVLVEPHYEWTGSTDALRGGVTTRRLALQRLEREVFDRTRVYRTHDLDDDGGGVHYDANSLVIMGEEIPRLFFAPPTAAELAEADEGNTESMIALLLGDSIADGAGANASLPPQQVGAMSGCNIWVPERGQFETLQAGVNNQTSVSPAFNLHGPEMGLAELMRGEQGQIWLVKGACLGSYATRHHATFLFAVAPCFDLRVTDWHPASTQEFFDLYVRGHFVSAVDALRRSSRKPVLGPVFISLGSNDLVNPNVSYPGVDLRDISHPDELGLALEELALAILEEATKLGVDTTQAKIVFSLPSTTLEEVDGAVAADIARGRESIFAMLDRNAEFKAADLTGLTLSDDIHPDAAGNVVYAKRLYAAWASSDTSRSQPLFVPSLAEMQKLLRLSAVSSTSDAQAMIENAIVDARVEFFQVLGSTAVTTLRAYPSTKTPETTAELLRKQAEVAEAKMVRVRLMRSMPTIFMDGSAPTQTWNDEAAFRDMGDKTLAAEIRRLEDEIDAALNSLKSQDLSAASVVAGATIEPDDSIDPGDTIFVRTI